MVLVSNLICNVSREKNRSEPCQSEILFIEVLDRLFSCDDLQGIVFKKIDLTKNEYLIKNIYIFISKDYQILLFSIIHTPPSSIASN